MWYVVRTADDAVTRVVNADHVATIAKTGELKTSDDRVVALFVFYNARGEMLCGGRIANVLQTPPSVPELTAAF